MHPTLLHMVSRDSSVFLRVIVINIVVRPKISIQEALKFM